MVINDAEKKLNKLRNLIWYERLLYLPAKLAIGYVLYAFVDNGIFFIIAYILYCLGQLSARQLVNANEAEATIENAFKVLSDHFSDNYSKVVLQLEKFEDLNLELIELELRVSDLEEFVNIRTSNYDDKD